MSLVMFLGSKQLLILSDNIIISIFILFTNVSKYVLRFFEIQFKKSAIPLEDAENDYPIKTKF